MAQIRREALRERLGEFARRARAIAHLNLLTGTGQPLI
jgi:hypothetical protein